MADDDVLDAQPDEGAIELETNAYQAQLAESHAIQTGDYGAAHDVASQVDYTLNNAGVAVDPQLATDAQNEAINTDWASWHQNIASENQQYADQYLAQDDAQHAAEYQAIADAHQADADDYAHQADFEITHETPPE
jgi:hypothetical protein